MAGPDRAAAMLAGQAAFDAGDTVAANEIASYIDTLPPEIVKLSTPLTDGLDNIRQSLADAAARNTATTQSMRGQTPEGTRPLYSDKNNIAQNALGSLEGYAQILGSELTMMAEVLAEETAMLAGVMTPDSVKAKLGEWGNALMSTYVGQRGLEALQWGGQKWADYKREYPQEAKSVAAGASMAAMLSPPTKLATPATGLAAKGKAIKAKAKTQNLRERTEGVHKLMEPEPEDALGDIDQVGFWGTREITPAAGQQEIVEAVQRVKLVNPNKSATYNAAKVRDAARVLKSELDARIIKHGNPQVLEETLERNLILAWQEIKKSPTIVGDAEQTAKKVIDVAMTLWREGDGSALAMLEMRRLLDTQMKSLSSKKGLDGSASARDIAEQHVRRAFNNTVDETVPKARLKDSLAEQHKLLSAREFLHAKGVKENGNSFMRIMHNIRDTTGLTFPHTPLAIGATASVATGAMGATIAGVAATGAAVTGLAWLTSAGLKSPQARTLLGSILLAADKAIKVATGPQLAQLKADRILLVDLMNSSEGEE